MVRSSVVKPKGYLKIHDKVKIIKLHAEEGQSLGMRKFTDLVEIKLGLIVSRATIQRIIKEKSKILAVPEHYWATKTRPFSDLQAEFEQHLYKEFVRTIRRTGFAYETVKTLGKKILQKDDEFSCLREKMLFSKNWFQSWQRTYKVGWAMIHGSKKYFPKEVIEGYRADYRDRIQNFLPQHCYNFDESAFLHSWLGRMSYIPMNGVDEAFVEKGSDKLRMTAGSFVNLDGSDNYQTYIVKSYAKDLKGL